ncbi:unnamed protein product [Protopolystoma xenopodis]|uniref:Uncharacterized protein n=1 Tax=Protopolystoma xenopodis TaxID=117903 RepID=A0A3S5BEH3_9PLAT|nr:unnamed protein product [Protopolystoma xenopodis]
MVQLHSCQPMNATGKDSMLDLHLALSSSGLEKIAHAAVEKCMIDGREIRLKHASTPLPGPVDEHATSTVQMCLLHDRTSQYHVDWAQRTAKRGRIGSKQRANKRQPQQIPLFRLKQRKNFCSVKYPRHSSDTTT